MELSYESLPCICVRWKTEAPKIGLWRRTPYFHLLNNELCLELDINWQKIEASGEIVVRVVWRRGATHAVDSFHTRCYIHFGRDTLFEERNIDLSVDEAWETLVHTILKRTVDVDPFAEAVDEWTILCQLSCNKSFEDQVEKKIIDLTTVDDTLPSRSVDRCVQVSSEIPRDDEALSHDCSRLLKEQILSDFKVKCGDRIFPVHRNILAARSDVFRAMFLSEMEESKTGSADIRDLQVPVLDLLLKFIYSGKPDEITVDNVADLYEASDKYAVRSLMTACSYYMIRNVTVENCVNYLKTAVLHSDPDLKAGIASFVLEHPDVFKRADWREFSAQHPVVANEVLQAYVSSSNQSLLRQTP